MASKMVFFPYKPICPFLDLLSQFLWGQAIYIQHIHIRTAKKPHLFQRQEVLQLMIKEIPGAGGIILLIPAQGFFRRVQEQDSVGHTFADSIQLRLQRLLDLPVHFQLDGQHRISCL